MEERQKNSLLFCVGCVVYDLTHGKKRARGFDKRDFSEVYYINREQDINERDFVQVAICEKCAEYVLTHYADAYNCEVINDIKNAVKALKEIGA